MGCWAEAIEGQGFTIQVHIRHRVREEVRELREWLESSLEGILVEEGLWETGIGSLAPEIPKIIEVLGDPREESPTLWEGDTVRHTDDCGISECTLPDEVDAGGRRVVPPFALHPSSQRSRKGKEGQLEEWA
jgi:hypothetical protein